MKKILLSIAGFCLLASFTIHTKHITGIEDIASDCPECKEESDKCIDPLHKAYTDEVSAAADKLKAGKITREEYDKICFEARNKKNKQLRKCLEVYNACCFNKTQEIMDKEKQTKQSIN